MRQSDDLDRFRGEEVGGAVEQGTASPAGIGGAHDVVAVVLGEPGDPAVDRMKVEVAEPSGFIDFEERFLVDVEMDSVAALGHVTAGELLVAHRDRQQQDGAAVRRHHLSGIEDLFRRAVREVLRAEQGIVFTSNQHRFEVFRHDIPLDCWRFNRGRNLRCSI